MAEIRGAEWPTPASVVLSGLWRVNRERQEVLGPVGIRAKGKYKEKQEFPENLGPHLPRCRVVGTGSDGAVKRELRGVVGGKGRESIRLGAERKV